MGTFICPVASLNSFIHTGSLHFSDHSVTAEDFYREIFMHCTFVVKSYG